MSKKAEMTDDRKLMKKLRKDYKTDKMLVDKEQLSPAQRAAMTLKEKYGENYFTELARKAGKASKNRPFRDNKGAATRAVNARWDKYRARVATEDFIDKKEVKKK